MLEKLNPSSQSGGSCSRIFRILGILACVVMAEAQPTEPTTADSGGPAYGYSLDSRPGPDETAMELGLIGIWEHSSPEGTILLEIVSEDLLIISGTKAKYRLVPGAIRLIDEYGEFDYPFYIDRDCLVLTMIGGDQKPRDVTFDRMDMSTDRKTQTKKSRPVQ